MKVKNSKAPAIRREAEEGALRSRWIRRRTVNLHLSCHELFWPPTHRRPPFLFSHFTPLLCYSPVFACQNRGSRTVTLPLTFGGFFLVCLSARQHCHRNVKVGLWFPSATLWKESPLSAGGSESEAPSQIVKTVAALQRSMEKLGTVRLQCSYGRKIS
jgi:hypothetical protein